jgi:hypothetical protein
VGARWPREGFVGVDHIVPLSDCIASIGSVAVGLCASVFVRRHALVLLYFLRLGGLSALSASG